MIAMQSQDDMKGIASRRLRTSVRMPVHRDLQLIHFAISNFFVRFLDA